MGSDNVFGFEPPKDANGEVIPFDTEALYATNGQTLHVISIKYVTKNKRWEAYGHGYFDGGFGFWEGCTDKLLLAPTDSFEKIAEDALLDEHSHCEELGFDYGDDSCPAEDTTRGDLVLRMEAVAARG